MNPRVRLLLRYALPAAAVGTALIVAVMMRVWVDRGVMIFFVAAVAVSGWQGGMTSALLGTVLASLAMNAAILTPLMLEADTAMAFWLVMFGAVGFTAQRIRAWHEVTVAKAAQDESRYRLLAENAQDLVYRYRLYPKRGYEYVSPSSTRVTGYTPEEYYADWQIDNRMMHPADRERMTRFLSDTALWGEPIINRVIHKDGAVIWLEHVYTVVRDETGRVVAADGIARDITEPYRSRERLELLNQAGALLGASLEVETTLQHIAALVVPGIADWCAVDRYEHGALRQIALTHADHQKRDRLKTILQAHSPRTDEAEPAMQAVRSGRTVVIHQIGADFVEAGASSADDAAFYQTLNFRAMLFVPLIAHKHTLGVITLIQSDSRRGFEPDEIALAEELARRVATALDNARLYKAAQEARQQLQVTLSSIGDAVIATDTAGGITFMNPMAERLTGWAAADARNKHLDTVFVISDEVTDEAMRSPYDKVMETGEIIALVNRTLLTTRTGEHLPISDSSAPIRDADGALLGVVIVFRDEAEKRQAENTRRASEIRVRTILENMPVMLSAFDSEYRLIVWNREAEEITGYPAEEVLGRTEITTLLFPDPAYLETLRQLRAQVGEPFRHWEMEVTRKDGTRRMVAWSNLSKAFPVPGWASWSIGLDVTKRYLSEQRTGLLQTLTAALAEARTTYEVGEIVVGQMMRAFGAHTSAIVLYDTETGWDLIASHGLSAAFIEKYHDAPLERAGPLGVVVQQGEPLFIQTEDDYYTLFPEIRKAGIGSKALVSIPFIIQGQVIGGNLLGFKDERQFSPEDRDLLIALAQQCAQALERIRAAKASQTVKERAQFLAAASLALTQSLDYLPTLESLTRLAIPRLGDWAHVDVQQPSNGLQADGKIARLAAQHIDPAMVELLYELNRVAPADPNAAMGVGKVIRTGERDVLNDIPVDVLRRYVQHERHRELLDQFNTRHCIIAPLSARGRILGAITFATADPARPYTPDDVSLAEELAQRASIAIENALLYKAEREARQAAEAADALKTRFLAMISHELRTPLTSIKGFATTLLAPDVEFTPEDQRQFVEIISEEADKLTTLISQLLDLSRLQADMLPINPQPQPFIVILEHTMSELKTLTRDHRLVLQLDETLPSVLADVFRIGQVVVNLVGNAVKYSPVNTPVTITAKPDGDFVRISVIDCGPGIPAEAREYVFEAFRQVENTDVFQQGAGLGLAICKKLVESHGGEIWIDDSNTQGLTIHFTLPVVREAAPTIHGV